MSGADEMVYTMTIGERTFTVSCKFKSLRELRSSNFHCDQNARKDGNNNNPSSPSRRLGRGVCAEVQEDLRLNCPKVFSFVFLVTVCQ